MSMQTINFGTAPTGVGGDTPRSAFTKTAENFAELYASLGAGGSPAVLPPALPVTKGGTGATNAAAARLALGLGTAAVAPLLGTVSQSGGLPTGAVIERGSNANGQYVKFADGTLLCTWAGINSMVANQTHNGWYITPASGWNFPATFVEIPWVGVNLFQAGASGLVLGTPYPVSVSSANWYGLAASALPGYQFTIRLMAIGRWY